MKSIEETPTVAFRSSSNSKSFFDIVTLENVLKKTPSDHKQTENHKLSFYVLFIITKGQGRHTIDYKSYSYRKGTVFSLRKGVTHKFTKYEAEGTLLIFTEDFIFKHLGRKEGLKSLQLFNELLESPKIELNASLFSEVEIILSQLYLETGLEKDAYTSSIKRSLLHVLVSKLYREKTKDKNVFSNTKYLNQFLKFQNLVEAQWSESRTALHYAEQMSITPKTLNNIVKSTIKKSAKSLIDNIVTTQIKHLLVNTELSVTEIAYDSGFDDPTNFFKYFKKNTKLSPNQFRETHK
ncbi:AraC family transcriptional regulator [Maribacter sp. 2308TA10-17]|uniref:AraC family transcriptional regulator n=1 Tax=Maribacter sp. 2308TA10-17 TaxID=3386276 RepID=UPI0039BC7704